ncbi:carbohydrate ABC transporter permease [Lactiplantibacillus plantarum]|uniref:carbohydrate ABC transporter permease n=1 Tax=Lactiplantibacillus plantarum TaxID=1590 RepID=UPI0007B54396|nr:sugar ABC transporter permease [Lactiplantibacillus plantarum]KZT81658.1 Maltose/maltodextrin ABC transporter permeaseprotein MalF [Lactiplantibacillus plantarum]KZT88955.1 Maltose/maltodextrin ABC transporter permeaseprotein MalF [Lactiplantibacillus plantarum]KZU38984.1 Maltose/maltodextrin ABC transporter permeaseprotein MalF [Lactiplantibacillus plantarum]KZU48644.1 Maltose/maltodextrin ABC transporter permeaseprotein MalF [Lactiplantibacillus plantarum]MCG0586611.1 sugar ABC transporte
METKKKPLKLARGLNGEHGQVWEAYLFLTPAFVIAAVFFVAAIVFALYMSFNHVNMISQQFEFTGFKNYIDVFKDNVAMTALKNTALFSVIVVPIQTIIALLIAYALSTRGIKGKKLFRLVYFLPTLTSSAALTLIFMFIFNISGPLNNFLISMGLYQHPINFLQNPAYALKVIMVMNIWSTVPNYMTVYLASLVDLPDSFYEAAEIDGASAWQKLRYITIPYLRPITTYVLLTGIIGTFQMFDQAYIFSNGSGGPDNSTLTIALMVYQYAFGSMNTMGYACTLAIVLTVIIFVVSRLTEKLNGSNGLR